eukprot:g1098.t1
MQAVHRDRSTTIPRRYEHKWSNSMTTTSCFNLLLIVVFGSLSFLYTSYRDNVQSLPEKRLSKGSPSKVARLTSYQEIGSPGNGAADREVDDSQSRPKSSPTSRPTSREVHYLKTPGPEPHKTRPLPEQDTPPHRTEAPAANTSLGIVPEVPSSPITGAVDEATGAEEEEELLGETTMIKTS